MRISMAHSRRSADLRATLSSTHPPGQLPERPQVTRALAIHAELRLLEWEHQIAVIQTRTFALVLLLLMYRLRAVTSTAFDL